MTIIIIIVSLLVLTSIVGIIKRNRILFNSGYFLYGLIVFVAELGNYNDNGEISHLAIAFLWLVQSCLAIPNKLSYDGSKIAKSSGVKVFTCYTLINAFGVILAMNSDYLAMPIAIIHGILAVLPLIPMYLVLTNKVLVSN